MKKKAVVHLAAWLAVSCTFPAALAYETGQDRGRAAQGAAPVQTSLRGLCWNLDVVGQRAQDEFAHIALARDFRRAEAVVAIELAANGDVTRVDLLRTSQPDVGDLAVRTARQLQCKGQGVPVRVNYPVVFVLLDD